MSAKGEVDVQNKLYLLYEIKVRNTVENYQGEKYDEVHTYYWYLCYTDVYVDKDGIVQSSITDGYEVTSDQFKIDSEVWTGDRIFHSTYTWDYTGYQTRNELYNDTVNKNAEKYTVEENLSDSVE